MLNTGDNPRENLGYEILYQVDNTLGFGTIHTGELYLIEALDAITHEPKSYLLQIASVRTSNSNKKFHDVVFIIVGGNLVGYDFDLNPMPLAPGTYMESGFSATFIPHTDIRLVPMNGIALRRDYRFDYVDGEDKCLIFEAIQSVKRIKDEGNLRVNNRGLFEYISKVAATKKKESQESYDAEKTWENNKEEFFCSYLIDNPLKDEIRSLVDSFSKDGQICLCSILLYAIEDKIPLEKVWALILTENENIFKYQLPTVRGNPRFQIANDQAFGRIIKGSGIKWPRNN